MIKLNEMSMYNTIKNELELSDDEMNQILPLESNVVQDDQSSVVTPTGIKSKDKSLEESILEYVIRSVRL